MIIPLSLPKGVKLITYLAISQNEAGKIFKMWTKKEPDFNNYILLNSFFFGAYDDDRIVGAVHLSIINDPFYQLRWGRIEKIYVTEEYRRTGIAKELMHQAINQTIALGCSFMRLDTENWNNAARELYKSLGFSMDYSYCLELKQ